MPAPDVHPAFRTRVMAHVRETPRESAAQVVSWPWRTFAAMVVLVPVAALFYVMQFAAEEPRPLDGDRALVQYLMNNDEDEILFRLSELYDDEMDAEWSGSFSLDAFESVDDTVWLDVLAMDPAFGEWANGAEFSEGALWDVDALLEDGLREETTI